MAMRRWVAFSCWDEPSSNGGRERNVGGTECHQRAWRAEPTGFYLRRPARVSMRPCAVPRGDHDDGRMRAAAFPAKASNCFHPQTDRKNFGRPWLTADARKTVLTKRPWVEFANP